MFAHINPKDLEEGRKYLMSGSVGGGLPILIENGEGAVVKNIMERNTLIVHHGHGHSI